MQLNPRSTLEVPSCNSPRRLSLAANESLPKRRKTCKRLVSSDACQRLYAQLKRACTARDRGETRRILQALRRRKKKEQEESWEQASKDFRDAARKNNWRLFYKLLNSRTGRRSSKLSAIKNESSGMLVEGEKAAAIFADYFKELLNRALPQGDIQSACFRPVYACESGPPSIFEVRSAITSMRSFSAPGPDGIWPLLLQRLPHSALRALTHYYQQIWLAGQIPDGWRTAAIMPQHKKGDAAEKSNYRGISLLSSLYKVLEDYPKEVRCTSRTSNAPSAGRLQARQINTRSNIRAVCNCPGACEVWKTALRRLSRL